jgi:hypothetical protein
MARSIPLIAGAKYYAGANLPFYVSRSMVTGYLEGKGFSAIRWHDKGDAMPAGLDPMKDPQYSDDWDEWAEATYAGTGSGVLQPPASPAWLRVELPAAATSPVLPLPATAPGPAAQSLPPSATSNLFAPDSIAVDPVIARAKRLGVVAVFAGGLTLAGSLFWSILRGRAERANTDEVQP